MTLTRAPGSAHGLVSRRDPVHCRRSAKSLPRATIPRSPAQPQWKRCRLTTERGHDVVVKGGAAVPVLFAEPAALSLSKVDWIGVIVPRTALGSMAGNIEEAALNLIPNGNEALRLLLHYLQSLEQGVELESPELRDLVVTHVHDLLALAVGPTRDSVAAAAAERGVRAARLSMVKADVLENIGYGGATIHAVAERQRMSRATSKCCLRGRRENLLRVRAR